MSQLKSKRPFFIFVFLLTSGVLFSQNTYKISGTVKDASTKESLIGVNIFVVNSGRGVATDINGKYEIGLKEGSYELRYSYVGYETLLKKITVTQNTVIDILLTSKNILEEIEVTAKREDINVKSTEGSRVEISMDKIERIPVLFGEADILKTIQLMPGIQSGGEGSNSFYVRGGGPDQNLILLDNATVYNASHMAGFFSVFNSSAISSAEIIKGGMPAEYGGRISSILNIKGKEGSLRSYSGEVGIGMISSFAAVEGPIIKEKLSFQLSVRRTYIDLLLKPFLKTTDFAGSGYNFYDINGKLFYKISEKDNISFTTYIGDDYLDFSFGDAGSVAEIDWGNRLGVLNWNHIFNEKLYVNTSFSYTNYKFGSEMGFEGSEMGMYSGVKDFSLKTDFSFVPNKSNKIKFGLNYTYHTFSPTSVNLKMEGTDFLTLDESKNDLYGHEIAAYIQHEWEVSEKLRFNYGVRYSYFVQTGPFKRYIIEDDYDKIATDSVIYKTLEKVCSYQGLEPRINARFGLGENNSLKASYSYNKQYAGLASLSTISLPTDIWYPVTEIIKPQSAHQVSFGYYHNLMNNQVETSVEVYYKDMNNLLEYKDGASPANSLNTNSDYDFMMGKGKSYGIEFFINKTVGQFTGWIGYTLSWTKRKFDDINDGEEFYARYDRRHDVSLLASYTLNEKWSFSLVWVFASGAHMTLPTSFYFIDGRFITEYGKRNDWTMPPNHRLDVSATWRIAEKRHYSTDLNFSVYNVYSRMNPYFIFFDREGNISEGSIKITPKQVSLFPIIPSATLIIKFK